MKTAYFTGLRKIEILEAEEPRIQDSLDVLVQIDAVGVCGSDVHYHTQGRIGEQKVLYPQTLGHECTGTLLRVGPGVCGLRPGQRVAIEPALSCGLCDQCLQKRYNTCRRLQFMGCPGQAPGTLAERRVVPGRACIPVPSSLTQVQAVLAEPLSIALHAVRLAGLACEPSDDPPLCSLSREGERRSLEGGSGARVAVLGTGPIGLSVILALRDQGVAEISATDLLDYRLKAAAALGARQVFRPDQDGVSSILSQEPLGLDAVFECAGAQSTLDEAVVLLKPGGVLVLVGIPESDRISFNMDLLRRKELRIQNVRRQNECLEPAVEILSRNPKMADVLITHRFGMERTQQAFDLVAGYSDGVIKAVIEVG